MNKVRALVVLGVLAYLSGCATSPAELSPELQSELNKPLYCEGEENCRIVWERATFFVNNNAGFKLQVHNDTVIQTYNPSENSPGLAFSISKEPLGNGRYQIWTKAWCANIFGCQPNQYEAIAMAKKYMRSGNR